MLKKILATALAAAMILGLASVAAAASFSDTADSAREASIQRLAGLGLLNGYPDGTFRPDNSITRAEFSKVIVYGMGLKDAAEMLGGVPVGFSDVAANHWASGFISIAASQDIIKGYPDGTFRPEANVSYAEAITMIMRALGYEPVLKNGTWPTVYITKAAELKINKGISFTSNNNATRGDVAGLLANAVTVAKLIQTGYGDTVKYVVSGTDGTDRVTLLHDMGAESVEGWLIDSPELFSNDGTTVKLEGAAASRDLVEDTDCIGLLGHEVRLWVNEDNEVFFVEDITDADAVQAATAIDADTVEIDDTEDEVDLPAASMFRNFADANDPDFVEDEELTVIFDGDDPKFAVITTYEWGTVDDISTTYSRILFDESSVASSITLKDFDVIWSGAAAELEDLEEGDVVQYIRDAGNEKAIIIVTRNSVTGEFTKLTGSAATVDGVAYGFVDDAVGIAYDLLGEDVTVLLNKDGDIVYMETEEVDTTSTYAVVVTKTAADAEDEFGNAIRKVKLVNSDESVATMTVTSAASANFALMLPGDVIEYETNSSGNINVIDIVVEYADQDVGEVDDDLSTIALPAFGTAKVTSATIVFDLSDFVAGTPDEDDVAVVSVSSLLSNGDVTAAALVSAGKAKVVALTVGDAEGDEALGMVYGSYRSVVDGDPVWMVRIIVEGAITEYVATDLDAADTMADNVAGFDTKKVASFTDLGSDEMEGLAIEAADVASDVYTVRVSAIDVTNGLLTIKTYDAGGDVVGTASYYMVDEDTLYFDVTGTSAASTTLEELAKMSEVSLYLDADGVVEVLVVHPED